MTFLHFEDHSKSLNRLIAIHAPDEEFESSAAQVFFVDTLPIELHDVLIRLHLAELHHEDVERVFGVDVHLR